MIRASFSINTTVLAGLGKLNLNKQKPHSCYNHQQNTNFVWMYKALLATLMFSFSMALFGRESSDTIDIKDVNLDLLKSPTNSTFILMNTTPTDLVEPGSAPEFFASIQNASNNFSTFPNNFGFSVTPFWWGKKAKELSFDTDFASKNDITFYRTLNFSGGIVKGIGAEENLWRYALGAQVTLLRGKIDPNKRENYIAKLSLYHDSYNHEISSFWKEDFKYSLLIARRDSIMTQIQQIPELLRNNTIDSEQAHSKTEILAAKLKVTLSEIDARKVELDSIFEEKSSVLESSKELDKSLNDLNQRFGFKWDIGGGSAFNSNFNKVDSLGVYRIGIWSNASFTPKSSSKLSNFTGIVLTRFLHFNDVNYLKDESVEYIESLNTFDIGGKLQFTANNKFKVGIEYIYRVALSSSLYENNYKLNAIVQYHLGKNRLVYGSFGNNFNDLSDYGPTDLVVTFGINIGIGDNITIKNFKLN